MWGTCDTSQSEFHHTHGKTENEGIEQADSFVRNGTMQTEKKSFLILERNIYTSFALSYVHFSAMVWPSPHLSSL